MSYKHQVATVFGGSGFIGRHLIRRLARAGVTVRVPSRTPAKANFLKPNGVVGQIVPVYCNINDDASVRSVIEGSTLVINLVAILAESGNQTFQRVHVEAAERIARIARESRADRMVHVSAIGADAQSPSAYGRSKAEGETAVRQAFPDATILRPSIIFGPEDSFFNRFATMARFSPALPLIGGGHTKFQVVYVGDVADAAMVALTQEEPMGKTYELGGPRIYTFRQLMEMMLQETRRKRLLVNLPWGMARFQAKLVKWLPNPPITLDQIEMLKVDNVVSEDALTLETLGISPQALEIILPTYMDKFRIGGRFSARETTA